MQFGKQAPVRVRGVYPLHIFKRGLRVEIVREYYDGACVSANILPVCSGVHFGWGIRMDVPRRGLDQLKNTNMSN